MKLSFLKSIPIILFFASIVPANSFAQDLTGIWKGEFKTEFGESYKLEFQIAQNKNKTVTGVSYSYGMDIKFYGKAVMTGNYAISDGSFIIQETKTVEVKSAGGTCLMNYKFTYSRSGNEEFLEGTYIGKTENRADPSKNGVWGDCGGGVVSLRRVKTSDFYVEPFLRNKPAVVRDTAEKKSVTKPTTKPVTKPKLKPVVVHQKPLVKPKPIIKNPVTIPKKDTVRKKPDQPIVIDKPIDRPKIEIPVVTRSRQNELVQTLVVTSDEINIRLYDNGEVDGDTISVYLDGKPLVTNKGLSTVPITLNIKLDAQSPEHTLVMVAENMGRIPPNTSLMIVQDGDKRYQVSITSTEQKNAMVRFRYQKN